MNAKTGSDNTDRERAMGREGCGIINDNGEKFVNFCLNNNCVIGGTIFQHKEIHKLTWKSPDGRTVNQIDHVVINNKWRRSLKDVHTCRGADAGSDHYLVVSRLKLCLRKAPIKHDRQMRYNIARLKHEDTQKAFVLEVKNQFQKLMYNHIISFMNKNDVLYDKQFGFRQKHSTQQAIIMLVDKITRSLDAGDIVISVFLDLKKGL